MDNPFLRSLLTLQQDGSGAISSPSNWISTKPLLRVETPAIQAAREFAQLALASTKDSIHWRFLVGGPGNGKSLAVRELVVALLDAGAAVRSEEGLDLSVIPVGTVPSILEVIVDGRLLARIAQDASVVPNPFSADPDPAKELASLLERCASDRCHLIACTNRGVLEGASRVPASAGAGTVLASLVVVGTDKAGAQINASLVVQDGLVVDLSAIAIDGGSLFSGGNPPFLRLIEQAISVENWSVCASCNVRAMCPFAQNRDALALPEVRGRTLRLLEDAELLDGQPLVFREAAALVSLFLAGCPADYDEGGPCGWVASNVERERWFHLASRRLHMLLFSSVVPLGIESAESTRLIELLLERSGMDSQRVLGAPPAQEVGVRRLLGPTGALKLLDPLAHPLAAELESGEWEARLEADSTEYAGSLELRCLHIWRELDNTFEDDWNESSECMAALSRWRSAHMVRCGAMETGLFAWQTELSAYRRAVGIPALATLRERDQVRALVISVLDSDAGLVRIGKHIQLKSPGLILDIDWNASQRVRALCITLAGGEGRAIAKLNASAFVWLYRRHHGPLFEATFPLEWLETTRDAISRAAAAAQYSRLTRGELHIAKPDGELIRLIWEDELVEASQGEPQGG